MARIAIITNVIPDYRSDFYARLIATFGTDLHVYCQDHIPGMNLKLAHETLGDNLRLVKVFSRPRESIVWQRISVARLITDYDIYFFEGNPRIVSSVLLATSLRLIGKPVVIWGQRHTAGANPLSEKARLAWWRLFAFIFLYTDKEVSELRAAGFRSQTLLGMNNGLDQLAIENEKRKWSDSLLGEWQARHALNGKRCALSCARLVGKNDFQLMIAALPTIVARCPDFLWIVIGDGEELAALRNQADTLGVAAHIRWLGALHDEATLAPWFLSARLFVHPGAIGLSLLHAYGYGLPVITHNDAQAHMPEYGAMPASNVARCFTRGDADALSRALIALLQDPAALTDVSADARDVASRFNTAVMAQRFQSMVQRCLSAMDGNDKDRSAQRQGDHP